MNPNHKPNWKYWTPPECRDYWQGLFDMAIEYHASCLAFEIPIEEFQQTDLDCIERILTDDAAQEFWEQLNDLNVPPSLFITHYHCALEGGKRINHAKIHRDYAAKVEKQTNELLATLENSYLFNSLIPNLEPIFERARYLQSVHENERKIVKPKTKIPAIDATYFRESLSEFFKKWTQSARHNLVTIAFNVTFSEKIEPETMQKKINRRQQKQTVS